MRGLIGLTLLLVMTACVSTSSQEALMADGSFSPEFELSLEPESREVCAGDVVTIRHSLRNVTDDPAWVCVQESHELYLGRHGYSAVTSHPVCFLRQVLAGGEEISWNRDLKLAGAEACGEQALEAIRDLMGFCGSLDLRASGIVWAAPPGKKWPKRSLSRKLEAEGPKLVVNDCRMPQSTDE